MPLKLNASTTGGTMYTNPFEGPVDHTQQIKIDLSGLTTSEVDADGYLKPGVPFYWNTTTGLGILVASASGNPVMGVNPEAVQLPVTTPATNTTLAAETGDCFVALVTHGVVNRDIAEDNLGRAYTADEIAGFRVAGSNLSLTQT